MKQLVNGKFFWDWLVALLSKHGYLDVEVKHIGLFIWQPREKSVRKGKTAHKGIFDRTSHSEVFDRQFEVRNYQQIPLLEMIKNR